MAGSMLSASHGYISSSTVSPSHRSLAIESEQLHFPHHMLLNGSYENIYIKSSY